MRGSTRTGWVAGLAALSLVLAACGSDDDGDASESPDATEAGGGATGGEVVIANCTPENPLIPSNTNESCGADPLDPVFTYLVEYDPVTAEPVNAVAESIESDDNQTWTITLNEGFTFHDGTPVTAESFVNAWNWAAYGPNAQLNSYFFGPDGASIEGFAEVQGEDANDDGEITEDEATVTEMSGLEVVDDLTFTVTLTRPFSIFPSVIGYNPFAPLPESFYDDPAAFGEAPIGNGPYQVVEASPNEQIVLEAYEDYTGEDAASIQRAVYRTYNDLDAAYADLLAGNVDIMVGLPTSALAGEQFKSDLGDRQTIQETGRFDSITAPVFLEEFQDYNLRLALSKAIDRQAIADTIFEGVKIPADSYVSPVVDGYVEGACGDACVYDPDAAVAAFEASSGFEGTLTLEYNADGDHKAWTEAVCNNINQVLGIECVASPVVDFSTFRAQINAGEQTGLTRSAWIFDYPNIESFLGPLYATTGSANDGQYSNEEFDGLLGQAAQASTQEEANTLYQQAEQVLVGDLPVIPLWFGLTAAGWSENVDNVTVTPYARVDLPSLQSAG